MSAQDSALIGAAGENYVLYQLHLQGLLAAPAPTGAAIADLIVFDPSMSVGSMVQVKTTRLARGWVMGAKNEEFRHLRLFYALVALVPGRAPEVFIVPSEIVVEALSLSHRAFLATSGHKDNPVRSLLRRFPSELPGYPDGWLDQYRDRWDCLTAEP